MSAITASTFDAGFGAISANDLAIVRAAEKDIRSRQRRVYDDAVAIGRELIRVKAILAHGKFETWVSATFTFSASSALNFMRLAETLGDKSTTVADLPLGVLYRAAAAKITDDEREQLFAPAAKGAPLTEGVVSDRLADLRADKKQQEQQEREAAKDTPARRAREKRTTEKRRAEREEDLRRSREFEQRETERTRDVARFLIDRLGANGVDELLKLWGREIRPQDIPAAIRLIRQGQAD